MSQFLLLQLSLLLYRNHSVRSITLLSQRSILNTTFLPFSDRCSKKHFTSKLNNTLLKQNHIFHTDLFHTILYKTLYDDTKSFIHAGFFVILPDLLGLSHSPVTTSSLMTGRLLSLSITLLSAPEGVGFRSWSSVSNCFSSSSNCSLYCS